MTKKSSAIVAIILLFLCVFVLWRGIKHDVHYSSTAMINKPFPAFSQYDLQQLSMVINEKEFLGKISLLNIWSSWCISCRYEHDILLDIAKDNKISVYGLNYRDNRDDALSMLNNYGNPYKKIIFDPKGDLAINLGVYGTPETYLIDRDGIIRYSIIGPLSWDVWRSKVVKILAMLGE